MNITPDPFLPHSGWMRREMIAIGLAFLAAALFWMVALCFVRYVPCRAVESVKVESKAQP